MMASSFITPPPAAAASSSASSPGLFVDTASSLSSYSSRRRNPSSLLLHRSSSPAPPPIPLASSSSSCTAFFFFVHSSSSSSPFHVQHPHSRVYLFTLPSSKRTAARPPPPPPSPIIRSSMVGTSSSSELRADAGGSGPTKWKGRVVLQKRNFLDLNNPIADLSDRFTDLFGSHVYLQLVSEEADPETGDGKRSSKAYLQNWFLKPINLTADKGTEYFVEFKVEEDFGTPGAILVENNHPNAFRLKEIVLEPEDDSTNAIKFPCDSWVYKPNLSGGPRIFFTNKRHLPSETPRGLRNLRTTELKNLQGDGTGERIESDRIYDYEVYNDLGNPDKSLEYARTALGGSESFPYPRRCRTGRKPTTADPTAETPLNIFSSLYVPSDEGFDQIKTSDFFGSTFKAVLHAILPYLKFFLTRNPNYRSFEHVHSLYARSQLESLRKKANKKKQQLQGSAGAEGEELELLRQLTDPRGGDTLWFKFPVPEIIQVDVDSWRNDVEFARQMLAGINPMAIERLTSFPPTSDLDPTVYGSTTSAITAKHLEANLDGLTVDQALKEKRLYILDFHDLMLPYMERINKLKGKNYATRTILFLKSDGTLKPVAIELSLPRSSDGAEAASKRVFTPPPEEEKTSTNSKGDPLWNLWQLAKLHVVVNDSAHHELISHWLRTHATMEPIVIATRRQLSSMHPIYRLLLPHFKNTMRINATARNNLINSFSGSIIDGGIIEYGFTAGRYAMELSSVVYKNQWRLDEQSLPADLIRRGVAEADESAEHGLRLLIPDYPYAVDGLDIWQAISGWAHDYVHAVYASDEQVADDVEVQEWWGEVRYKGHADKALEKWWPAMRSRRALADVAATFMWLASAHHAAVNFGQFGWGGYPPARPSMSRRLVPEEGSPEYDQLLKDSDRFFMETMSTGPASLLVIGTLEILSTHAANEEYVGDATPANTDVESDEAVRRALHIFHERLAKADAAIRSRNCDPKLGNRSGLSGILYSTLFTTSLDPGLSGRGIPNSVSI